MADEIPLADPLYLACTRPAMVWGAPMEAMGLNIILTGFAFLAGGGLGWLLIGPTLHLIARALTRHEPNAFRLLWLHLELAGKGRLTMWGGTSHDPLPAQPARGRR
jgi:type IV secretion system protein VirB3